MFYDEKPKNEKPKFKGKNDYEADFDDLLSVGGDEPDDRVVRSKRYLPTEAPGCSDYVSASMQYPFSGDGVTGRLLITGVVGFIPVLGAILLSGYGIRVIRRVLRGQRGLPAWNDLGGDFSRGLGVFFGSIIFAILLALSTIAVITIPVVMFLGLPMVGYVYSRYAATEDFSAFFDLFGAYRYVLNNLWSSIIVTLAFFVIGFLWAFLIPIGLALVVLPGIILTGAAITSLYYLLGAWGRTVGVEA